MLKRRPLIRPLILDALAFTLAFVLAVGVLPIVEHLLETSFLAPGWSEVLPSFVVCLLLLVPALVLTDCYSIPRSWTGLRIFRALGLANTCMVVGYLAITIVVPAQWLPPVRKGVIVSGILAAPLLWYCRNLYPGLYTRLDRQRRALLVGAHTFALRSIQRFARDNPEALDIVGVVDDFRSGQYFANLDIEYFGGIRNLRAILRNRDIDTLIVLTDQGEYADGVIELLDDFPNVKEVFVRAQIPLSVAQDIDLLFVQEVPLLKVYSWQDQVDGMWWRAVFDRVVAALALMASSPVFLIVPILIKVDSSGPVFYRQKRLGKRNKPFWIYKFRSMRVDAEQKSGAVLAQKNDPRVTRMGRIMRALRIDEIPQILNVLQGDMSIIGPRPERPEFQNVYRETIPWYALRSRHKPGITGLAQVTGDYHTSAQRKLLYDVMYLANMGPLLDARILVATALTVLTKKGH